MYPNRAVLTEMTGIEEAGCSEMYPCIDVNSFPKRNAPDIVDKVRTTISGVISQ